MKMGITIEKATELSADYIAKRSAAKRKLIEDCIDEIDEMIAVNIDKILVKPTVVGESSWNMVENRDEIMASYKDFTISIHHNPQMVRDIFVKLADKDWDWYGYGAKPPVQDVEQPKPKKKRFLWWGKSKQPDRKFTVL